MGGNSASTSSDVCQYEVGDVALEVTERGDGPLLLFLHPDLGVAPLAPAIAQLARHAHVIAPSHPGFGRSPLPSGMNTVDDLAYFYLDLLEQHDLRDVTLVGASLGGWIAAAIAIKSTQRIARLVLVDALGVKFGRPDERDIADIFAHSGDALAALRFDDPNLGHRDDGGLTEEAAHLIARNRESAARFGWSPYMHDPKLAGRLHRVRIPTLVLWGENDRIVSSDYGRAYAARIPGAIFHTIDNCGHYPPIERPDEFVREVATFMDISIAKGIRA